MKEKDIQFNGRTFSVKYFGERSYNMESLVILPDKAKNGEWSTNMVGVNESCYVIYSPWDMQQGTGIALLICADRGVKVHLAIWGNHSSQPLFECDAEVMDNDGSICAFYPKQLEVGKYLLFVSDVKPSELCDSHYHAFEQGFFFEFDVLPHGSTLSLPKLGLEGSVERLDCGRDYVGTSGEVRFRFHVLGDLPETYKLSWLCYDSTFNEMESMRHGMSVEYDYAHPIYSEDGLQTMLIKIDSYIPWMPDSLYTVVLYYNDELFACCRFNLNSLALERKFLITPVNDQLHRDMIISEMNKKNLHPIEKQTFFYPDGIMRVFMDGLFFQHYKMTPAFEKKLAAYIIKYYDLLAKQTMNTLENIVYDGPIDKADKRLQRVVNRGEGTSDVPVAYDAGKDLHGFARLIKEWCI